MHFGFHEKFNSATKSCNIFQEELSFGSRSYEKIQKCNKFERVLELPIIILNAHFSSPDASIGQKSHFFSTLDMHLSYLNSFLDQFKHVFGSF